MLKLILPTFYTTGACIGVPLFGRSVVVVNTLNAARDLMDKNSANYSDRPESNLLDEYVLLPIFVQTTQSLPRSPCKD